MGTNRFKNANSSGPPVRHWRSWLQLYIKPLRCKLCLAGGRAAANLLLQEQSKMLAILRLHMKDILFMWGRGKGTVCCPLWDQQMPVFNTKYTGRHFLVVGTLPPASHNVHVYSHNDSPNGLRRFISSA
mmetsp:Transcript_15567/g.30621  ORF Transcript_15567/g.30621 Transcript_15567/m.30621 type:complete len:129 (+) Transcript_15567:165-551(+)